MPSINLTEVIGDYNTQQVLLTGIEWMLLIAFMMAFMFTLADRESRASVRNFISDLFVRWGIAGLGLWTIVLVFFGLYELGLQRGLFHSIPFIAIAEYGGVWGVAISGAIAFLFFVSSLFIQALIRAPTVMKVVRSPYYPYLEEYAQYLYEWWRYYQHYYQGYYQTHQTHQQEGYADGRVYPAAKPRDRSL
jgi:magnesium-transporting ATPase (P-type)